MVELARQAQSTAQDAAARVADFYKGSNLVVGATKRIAGLTLTAPAVTPAPQPITSTRFGCLGTIVVR